MTLAEAIKAVRDFLTTQQSTFGIVFFREFMPFEFTICAYEIVPQPRLRTFRIEPATDEPYCWQMKEV